MKKTRNSFFEEYGMNGYNNGFPMGMPNQAFSANSSFYSGPGMNFNPNYNNPNMYSDIDSRLSKIERQINRLETRISRLEGDNNGTTNINIDDGDYNSNPMYMV